MSLSDDLAAAIARFEGFYKSGSVAARNNNPGNLRSWGNYPVVDGYVQFPDAATGWAALRRQVQLNISRGLTLQEFFTGKSGVYGGYAPSADANDPNRYAATVAGWLGISPDVRLDSAGAVAAAWSSLPNLTTTSGEQDGTITVGLMVALGLGIGALLWLAV